MNKIVFFVSSFMIGYLTINVNKMYGEIRPHFLQSLEEAKQRIKLINRGILKVPGKKEPLILRVALLRYGDIVLLKEYIKENKQFEKSLDISIADERVDRDQVFWR